MPTATAAAAPQATPTSAPEKSAGVSSEISQTTDLVRETFTDTGRAAFNRGSEIVGSIWNASAAFLKGAGNLACFALGVAIRSPELLTEAKDAVKNAYKTARSSLIDGVHNHITERLDRSIGSEIAQMRRDVINSGLPITKQKELLATLNESLKKISASVRESQADQTPAGKKATSRQYYNGLADLKLKSEIGIKQAKRDYKLTKVEEAARKVAQTKLQKAQAELKAAEEKIVASRAARGVVETGTLLSPLPGKKVVTVGPPPTSPPVTVNGVEAPAAPIRVVPELGNDFTPAAPQPIGEHHSLETEVDVVPVEKKIEAA